MKIGFFTDLHAMGESPGGRTDNYRASIVRKLNEVGEIWGENNVEYVLFGGDLGHTPDPQNSVKVDLLEAFSKWNIPIITIVGSHDYYGYQPKSLRRTTVGLFHKSEKLILIGRESFEMSQPSFYTITDDRGMKIRIEGTSHTYWLCDDPQNFYCSKPSEISLQIQLVHGDLVDKPVPWQHQLCSNIKTESDIVLSGHYHPGWEGILTYGNTRFVNPGSIGRVERSSPRLPRVCIINTYDNSIEFKTLTSCEFHPFQDSGNEKIIDVESTRDISRLLNMLENTEVELIDIKTRLPMVAKELGYKEEVLDKAFEILENVNKE